MSNLLTTLTPHTTNIYEIVKGLHKRIEDLDLDIADVLAWIKSSPKCDSEVRSLLQTAEEGAYKAVANLEAILTATTLTPDD